MHCGDALAKGGELGLLEGRSVALLHPASMFTLLAVTGYSGYLGWKWRRQRTIGADIDNLKVRSLAALSDGCFFLINTKALNRSPLLQSITCSLICLCISLSLIAVCCKTICHPQAKLKTLQVPVMAGAAEPPKPSPEEAQILAEIDELKVQLQRIKSGPDQYHSRVISSPSGKKSVSCDHILV